MEEFVSDSEVEFVSDIVEMLEFDDWLAAQSMETGVLPLSYWKPENRPPVPYNRNNRDRGSNIGNGLYARGGMGTRVGAL